LFLWPDTPGKEVQVVNDRRGKKKKLEEGAATDSNFYDFKISIFHLK